MGTFIIIVSGVVLCVYGLTQSIRQRKHPQEKKNVSRKRNVERYYNDKNDDNGEMSEEEMIAEEYYFYCDKE